jgi:hypothetical protein
MRVFIRLVVGIVALLSITFMTMCFGIGGFFFTAGLFVVIIWAFMARL